MYFLFTSTNVFSIYLGLGIAGVTTDRSMEDTPTKLHKFTKILKDNGISRPNLNTITKIQKAGVLTNALIMGPDVVIETYQNYKELPTTFTCGVVENNFKIHVNGPSYGDSKPFLLSAVGEDGLLKIVKILRLSSSNIQSATDKQVELEMEKEACNILSLSSIQDGLITATVLKINIPQTHAQHTDSNCSEVVAIIMPKYLGTVATSPQFYPTTIYHQGSRLLNALKFIHSRGLVHMDVKADNVFIDSGGNWVLGDFGSCKHINDQITSTTSMFYHRKLGKEPALPKYDYYMLLVMLLIETLEDKHSIGDKFMKNDVRVNDGLIKSYANKIILNHEVGPIIQDLLKLID